MRRIGYLVHNLNDAAVARRVTMLRAGGAEVQVAGFCREGEVPSEVGGAPATLLGRTRDAALGQRAVMVLRNLASSEALLGAMQGADMIIARNLEMLALGVRVRGGRRLIYESLDIHRSLLGTGTPGAAIRGVERWLMRRAACLLVSSPAFLREYFQPVQRLAIPAVLVENKLLRLDDQGIAAVSPPAGPPWTIGWFGNLRCHRTLSVLREIADAAAGRVEILIAGKPSPAVFSDFAAATDHPRLTYLGAYRPADLPGLYGRCHFAWAIDYFEEGLNSTWLLPNRLYEAAAHGCVPIALGDVETGRWLAQRNAGLLLSNGEERATLSRLLANLDGGGYGQLGSAIAAIPASDLVSGQEDCEALVRTVVG